MIYVNDKLHAKSRPDLMTAEIEVLWLELYPFNSKRSLLIAGVYRPSSSTSDADASIAKNIEKAYLLNKEMVLLGDFNVDFLNANQASKHKLIEILTNLHLTQLVKEVTRPISGTCLDNIWSSHPEDWCVYRQRTLECQITFQQWRFDATKARLHKEKTCVTPFLIGTRNA